MAYFELIPNIISIVALVLSAYSIYISKKARKTQLQMSFFKEYTRRFQEITLNILNDPKNEVDYQQLYIDLCSEEYYLKSQGYLPQKVWDIWYKGMQKAVKKESLQTAWERRDLYDPDFVKFFNDLIINENKALS